MLLDSWVCCDGCDKWRLLSLQCYEKVKDNAKFFCRELRDCSCDDPADDTTEWTKYWSLRGGRLLLDKSANSSRNSTTAKKSSTSRLGTVEIQSSSASAHLVRKEKGLKEEGAGKGAEGGRKKRRRLLELSDDDEQEEDASSRNRAKTGTTLEKAERSSSDRIVNSSTLLKKMARDNKMVKLGQSSSGNEDPDDSNGAKVTSDHDEASGAGAQQQLGDDLESKKDPKRSSRRQQESSSQHPLLAIPYTAELRKELDAQIGRTDLERMLKPKLELQQWVAAKIRKALATFRKAVETTKTPVVEKSPAASAENLKKEPKTKRKKTSPTATSTKEENAHNPAPAEIIDQFDPFLYDFYRLTVEFLPKHFLQIYERHVERFYEMVQLLRKKGPDHLSAARAVIFQHCVLLENHLAGLLDNSSSAEEEAEKMILKPPFAHLSN